MRSIPVFVFTLLSVIGTAPAAQSGLGAHLTELRAARDSAQRRYDEAFQYWRAYNPARDSAEVTGARLSRDALIEEIRHSNLDHTRSRNALQARIHAAEAPRQKSGWQERSKLNSDINALLEKKRQAVRDLQMGYYCSKCGQTQSEFGPPGPTFQEHLQDVKAEAIPASAHQIRQKEEEFDRKIEAKQAEADRLQESEDEERRAQQAAASDLRRELSSLDVDHRAHIADLNRRLGEVDAISNRYRSGDDPEAQRRWQAVEAAEHALREALAELDAARESSTLTQPSTEPMTEEAPMAESEESVEADLVRVTEPHGGNKPGIAIPAPFERVTGREPTRVVNDRGPERAWENIATSPSFSPPNDLLIAAQTPPVVKGSVGTPSWLERKVEETKQLGSELVNTASELREGAVDLTKRYFRDAGEELVEFDAQDLTEDLYEQHVRYGTGILEGLGNYTVDRVESKSARLAQRLTRPIAVLREQVREFVVERIQNIAMNGVLDQRGTMRGKALELYERADLEISARIVRVPTSFMQVDDYVSDLTKLWSKYFSLAIGSESELYEERLP